MSSILFKKIGPKDVGIHWPIVVAVDSQIINSVVVVIAGDDYTMKIKLSCLIIIIHGRLLGFCKRDWINAVLTMDKVRKTYRFDNHAWISIVKKWFITKFIKFPWIIFINITFLNFKINCESIVIVRDGFRWLFYKQRNIIRHMLSIDYVFVFSKALSCIQ